MLLGDPHTRQAPAPTAAQLEELTRIGVGPSEPGGERPNHGALACSHGAFLHVARQTLQPPDSLHIMGPSKRPLVETTSGIQNPSCGRLAPPESGCAGGMELSPCRLLVQHAVFPGYSESV
jgi:hypothetical protein